MDENIRPRYPECDKMTAVQDESQAIGRFLEECGYTLCELHGDNYMPVRKTIEELLADHFEIDLTKVEEERQQILKNARMT